MIDTKALLLQYFIKYSERSTQDAENELSNLHIVKVYNMRESLIADNETIYCFYADFVDTIHSDDIDTFTASIYFRVTEYSHFHTIHVADREHKEVSKYCDVEYMCMLDEH